MSEPKDQQSASAFGGSSDHPDNAKELSADAFALYKSVVEKYHDCSHCALIVLALTCAMVLSTAECDEDTGETDLEEAIGEAAKLHLNVVRSVFYLNDADPAKYPAENLQ